MNDIFADFRATLAEPVRRRYLALLETDIWVQRTSAQDERISAQDETSATIADVMPAIKSQANTMRPSVPTNPVVADPAAALAAQERLAQLASLAREPAIRKPVSASVVNEVTPTLAAIETASAVTGERIGCAFLFLPHGVLLVAEYASPEAPGLGGDEHAMFVRLGKALSAPGTEFTPLEFSWPPAGMRVPGLDRPGAAQDAFNAFVQRQSQRGVSRVAALGGTIGLRLAPAVDKLGLAALVQGPSLAAMHADPALKRSCWEVLVPLRQGPAA